MARPKKAVPKPVFASLEESNAWMGLYSSLLCGALAGDQATYVDDETGEVDTSALARVADAAYDEFLSRVPEDDDEEEEEEPSES